MRNQKSIHIHSNGTPLYLAASPTIPCMQVPTVLTGTEEFGEFTSAPRSTPTCPVKLYIGNNGTVDVSDVDICVHAAWPVTLEEDSHAITCIKAGGGTPCIINLEFSYDSIQIPSSTEVNYSDSWACSLLCYVNAS